MSAFNLIDEPWIPVRFPDGRREELGIRDVLLRSKEIAAIEDPSPLVVAALHRLLLAVLYRALEGPTDFDQARAWFRDGLPLRRVEDYLTKWRDRFWLFDAKYPFGQIAEFMPQIWRAWTVLAAEHNADNAKVLFDHLEVEEAGSITPAAATRWLLATQTFSVSCGKSELAHTGTAPSATAALVLPLGERFSDTLLFALVPQNREVIREDLPQWERPPETMAALKAGAARAASGLADRYTWRVRSVRLEQAEAGRVERLAFASGVTCTSTDQVDPMQAYRVDKTRGRMPIQFHERGLWRDFDSLLPDDSSLGPHVVAHAASLARGRPDRAPRAIVALGQSNNKAKIEYWRMEIFALPGAIAGDRNLRLEITSLLAEAEQAERSLWSACRAFACNILSRGGREPASGDIAGFVKGMGVSALYWSHLEASFHDLLNTYDHDSEDVRRQWLEAIRTSTRMAWDRHRVAVGVSDAWTIRALVKAEGVVSRCLSELDAEIRNLNR